MRAVVFAEHGGPEKLQVQQVADPLPGDRELVVRVAYCGVNPLDKMVLTGARASSPSPHIMGSEVVGTVEATGRQVVGFRPGDRVAVAYRLFCGSCRSCLSGHENACLRGGAVGVNTQGGYAEMVAVPAQNAVPIPAGVSFEGAAAVTLSGLTAWHLTLTRARVRPGDRVLVFGATGGVGLAAAQIARMVGAYVMAVVGSPEKAARLLELRVDAALDRSSTDVLAEVKRLTGGEGSDVVVDPVGAATWPQSYAAAAVLGRWVTCGAFSGGTVELNLANLYVRQVEVIGSGGGTRLELSHLLEAVERGLIRPVVWKTFPLEEAPQALEALRDPSRFGKVLLKVG